MSRSIQRPRPNPASPADRVEYICDDASVDLLLTVSALEPTVQELARISVVIIDDLECRAAVAGAARFRPEIDVRGDPTAYVIYTSGSSGRPKGVDVSQSSICNFIHVITEVYDVRASDRVFQGMTIAFDFAIEEVWPTWAAGATLVAGPTDFRRVGAGLTAFLEDHNITMLYCVPTVLSTVEHTIDSIRGLMVGGEACPAELVERWAPGRRMLNTYGPTETTVTCVWSVLLPNRPVTIGIPVPTYTAIILNEDHRPVPDGEVGELCIGGPGVAAGYLNRPELTRDRFIPHPVDAHGGRIYRTGDLARVQEDGEIVYLGRSDAEVKIRGHRVDLGEIESVLMRDPLVPTAAVKHLEGGAGDELAAYLALAAPLDDAEFQQLVQRLWQALRATLAPYMVPAFIERIREMPMLPSGKVDRTHLPEPASTRLIGGLERFQAPETPGEKWMTDVWAQTFGLHRTQLSVTANFFDDLGGHSLLAATLVSRLREDPRAAGLSVMELYGSPTIRELSTHLEDSTAGTPLVTVSCPTIAPAWRVWAFGSAQLLAIYLIVMLVFAPLGLAYWWFEGEPSMQMLQMLLLSVPLTHLSGRWLLPLATARVLGRRIAPGWHRMYGWTHLRLWLVAKAMEASPLDNLAGSAFAAAYLRAYGADIDERAHVASGQMLLPSMVRMERGSTVGYATHLEGWSIEAGAIRCPCRRVSPLADAVRFGRVSRGRASQRPMALETDLSSALLAGFRRQRLHPGQPATVCRRVTGRRLPQRPLWAQVTFAFDTGH